jgi:hypothetical protein
LNRVTASDRALGRLNVHPLIDGAGNRIRRFATRLEFVCKNNQIIQICTDKRMIKIRYAEKNQSIPIASVQAVVLVRRRAQ